MQNRSTPPRAARRPEPQPPESDVAAIFERRLLARGIRSDDFLEWRNSTDLPAIPAITPIRFGRSAESSDIRPIAPIEPTPAKPASDTSDPDPSSDPEST